MNKLFTILFTLVFITACGGPSWDGQWSGVEKAVVDSSLEISDGSVSVMDEGEVEDTCTFDADESETTLVCEKENDKLIMSLEGDVISITIKNKVYTFKRD